MISRGVGWDSLYFSQAEGLNVLPTVDDAVAWANDLIAKSILLVSNTAEISRLRHSNPTRGAQQLVFPLAPLTQLGSLDGISAQVQKHLGALAEALAGKGAGSVRNARAVGEELPARWLARIVSEQLDLQNMWAASGTWPFFQCLHRKAHLEGQSIKSGKVSK